ncbi:hypothetical protein ACXDF8_09735 [Mycolicibacterium sp. CBM1]
MAVNWFDDPEERGYDAAADYLSLLAADNRDLNTVGTLQIADGYHRVCASYLTAENTAIPGRLASWTAH